MSLSQASSAEPALDLLMKMGLSRSESMLYLALLRYGCGCYRELTKWSKVPYGRVYQVLERLRIKGFVEKDGGRPAVYRGVEPVKAFQSYMMAQYESILEAMQMSYMSTKTTAHEYHKIL